MVVQMAKAAGARVITTGGTDEKCAKAKELGADVVVNYKSQDVTAAVKEFAPSGVNVVWETLREPDFDVLVSYLAERGRMVLMAGRDAASLPRRSILRQGMFAARRRDVQSIARRVADLLGRYESLDVGRKAEGSNRQDYAARRSGYRPSFAGREHASEERDFGWQDRVEAVAVGWHSVTPVQYCHGCG